MNIQLPLTRQWFDRTADDKTEDYREITPRYCNRFLFYKGVKMPEIWWFYNFFQGRSIQKTTISLKNVSASFKPFTTNTMTLGYPKSTDTDRIQVFEHAGIEIRTGREEWGAEKGKLYFVIKHGKRLNTKA